MSPSLQQRGPGRVYTYTLHVGKKLSISNIWRHCGHWSAWACGPGDRVSPFFSRVCPEAGPHAPAPAALALAPWGGVAGEQPETETPRHTRDARATRRKTVGARPPSDSRGYRDREGAPTPPTGRSRPHTPAPQVQVRAVHQIPEPDSTLCHREPPVLQPSAVQTHPVPALRTRSHTQ